MKYTETNVPMYCSDIAIRAVEYSMCIQDLRMYNVYIYLQEIVILYMLQFYRIITTLLRITFISAALPLAQNNIDMHMGDQIKSIYKLKQ